MGQIFMNINGNGYAYVSNNYPIDGERVTLTCVPDPGEILLQVFATDSWDHYIALFPDALQQSFIFRDAWNNMYIEVYFSGSTPPGPGPGSFPAWLLFKFKKRKKRIRNGW